MNLIQELRWRQLLQEVIPGTEEFLMQGPTSGYVGVDPTGDSMHIGNLLPVMMLVHLQRAGHKPIALVGGATAMVGDPSGKNSERQLLSEDRIRANAAGIRKQLEHFLDFDAGARSAELVNNYDWLGKMGFLEFLRDVGKHLTVSYMISKESVKKRLHSDSGISYTEFAYQLLQGYDFYYLYKHRGVRLQMGGTDQWGNITTGTELIRRMEGHESKAYAAVCPLLTREDGSKFGKTADGDSVWLDAKKTSPYQFFQYFMNVGDSDAENMIKIFTLKEHVEIDGLIAAHREDPGRRSLQTALAEDITLRVHGKPGLEDASMLTRFFFGTIKNTEGLKELNEAQWQQVAQSSDIRKISRDRLASGIGILDLLTELGITQSKGEARRSVQKDKSVKVNLSPVQDPEATVQADQVFFGKYLHIQRGKKNKYIVELE